MLLIEPSATAAVRLAIANLDSSARLRSSSAAFSISRCRRLNDYSSGIRVKRRNCIRAVAREQFSLGPAKQNGEPPKYHPLEEIAVAELSETGDANLTPAETTRTIVEVNSTAMMAFSCFAFDEIDSSLFWPDVDYLTDGHGNIYFRMKNEADLPRSLSNGENAVQVVIGEDPSEMSSENEFIGHSEMDFGIDELDDEDSDFLDEEEDDDDSDDDNYADWVDDEDEDSGGSLWDSNLDTMRSCHPVDFAKRLAEVVSDDPVKYIEQPSAKLVIQGFLRPAFIGEHSVVSKKFNDADTNSIAKEQIQDAIVPINGGNPEKELLQVRPNLAEELEKEEMLGGGTVYYKLEMFNILLVPYNRNPIFVETVDYMKAQPDALVHSAATIISHVEAGGENSIQALKSLCWRCKGIQVEEAALVGIDSLGFDVRICSGIQVQTLRFAFKKRAFSEYSAERQLNDLLFPSA